MKLVLDTNVLIAAFISHGTCNELFEHCGIHHEIILSAFILDELAAKLTGKFKYTQLDAESVVALVKSRSRILRALPSIPPTCRDPEDDNIIATAMAGKCACIVTGDKDLLDLECAGNIRIIAPASFWQFEAATG